MKISSNQKVKIKSIKKACKISDKCFDFVLPFLKEGVTEIEIVKLINYFLRKKSEGIAFKTIVAFGENSAEIHHQNPTNRKLKKGDFIMLDFGARINGYPSDMTRTLFLQKVSKKQANLYKTVLEAQKRAIKHLELLVKKQSLIKAFDVDKVARNFIISKKLPPMPHSLGHGIGRKVHSGLKISPKSKTFLKPGMIFSIEPAIYIKGFGGVRIEDLVILSDGKIEIITNSKRDLIIL
jgi:Xaa-Pro aminopeptidase